MKFKQKKIRQGVSIGQKLKSARIRKKFSIEDIEAKTKIRSKYIQAIEADHFSSLPNPVYIKGFLRTYSKLLGLSAGQILEQFQKENYGLINESPGRIQNFTISFKRFIFSPKTIVIGVASLLIISFVIFLVLQVIGFMSPPELVIYEPKSDGQTTKDEITIIGKTESGAAIYINNQPIGIDINGAFKEKVFFKNGTNSIEIKAENKAGRTNIKTLNFFADLKESTISTSQISKKLDLKVVIGPNSAWIKIDADGKATYQGIMLANSEKTFSASKEIILSTSNAGSTKVIVGDKDMGTLGNENEARKNLRYLAR